jgi:hypothetical protein
VDGAVTNRVTNAQTRKKIVTNACQVHLIGFCEFSCFSERYLKRWKTVEKARAELLADFPIQFSNGLPLLGDLERF